MDASRRQAIDENIATLCEELQVDAVIITLCTGNILETKHKQRIEQQSNSRDRTFELLCILKTLENGWEGLLNALDRCNQSQLKERLLESMVILQQKSIGKKSDTKSCQENLLEKALRKLFPAAFIDDNGDQNSDFMYLVTFLNQLKSMATGVNRERRQELYKAQEVLAKQIRENENKISKSQEETDSIQQKLTSLERSKRADCAQIKEIEGNLNKTEARVTQNFNHFSDYGRNQEESIKKCLDRLDQMNSTQQTLRDQIRKIEVDFDDVTNNGKRNTRLVTKLIEEDLPKHKEEIIASVKDEDRAVLAKFIEQSTQLAVEIMQSNSKLHSDLMAEIIKLRIEVAENAQELQRAKIQMETAMHDIKRKIQVVQDQRDVYLKVMKHEYDKDFGEIKAQFYQSIADVNETISKQNDRFQSDCKQLSIATQNQQIHVEEILEKHKNAVTDRM